MKKIFAFLMSLSMLLMSGCSSAPIIDSDSFSEDVSVTDVKLSPEDVSIGEDDAITVNLDALEVGDIAYYGDTAIEKVSDDDEGPEDFKVRSTSEGFTVSFDGNTSLDKTLTLTSSYRYFYIYLKNDGTNEISVTIGNDESTQSKNFYSRGKGVYYIYSTTKWAAKSHNVSFASSKGMKGNAKAMLCSTLAEAKAHN